MLPDIVSLQLFVRVAEARSITRAAESGHIALAAASRRLSLLEHQLGVRLLDRSPRGVELTPEGRATLFHVRRILAQVDDLFAELGDFKHGSRGHVRIQANQSAIAQVLPADLAAFAAQVPAVAIVLEERSSGEIVQCLREGATDVGIIMEGTPFDGLQGFEYASDMLVALVPEAHPLRDASVSFATLLDYDLVGLDGSTAISRLMLEQAAVARKPLRLRVQVKSFAALSKMVEAGLGIGILPEGAARALLPGLALRLVAITDEWAERRLYVCVRAYRELPLLAKRLVDHLTNGAGVRSLD